MANGAQGGHDSRLVEAGAEAGQLLTWLAGQQPAELAAFGRLERAERASQQRHRLLERLRGERCQPVVDHGSQIGVVHQHGAAAGEEPLHEGGTAGGRRARREGATQPALDPAGVPVCAVVQDAGRPAVHPAVARAFAEPFEQLGERPPASSMIDQRQGVLHAAETLDHHGRGVVVERGTRRPQPCQHPHDETVEHRHERRGIGGADVSVALGLGERAQRRHQLAHIRIVGGAGGELANDRIDGVGQRRQQRQVERTGDLDQRAGVVDAVDQPVRGRLLDRGAVTGVFDDPDRPLGAPRQVPGFAERAAAAASVLQRTPRNADRRELVQEV